MECSARAAEEAMGKRIAIGNAHLLFGGTDAGYEDVRNFKCPNQIDPVSGTWKCR
jgi:hypothetical protein